MQPSEYVISRMNSCGFSHLPINHQHALLAGSLPLHHHDPFDRMLIAQTIFEEITLITVGNGSLCGRKCLPAAAGDSAVTTGGVACFGFKYVSKIVVGGITAGFCDILHG